MTTTEIGLLAGVVLQLFTLLALIVGVARRIATKDDIKRLDARIDQTNADMKAGFLRIDERFESQDDKFDKRFAELDAKFTNDLRNRMPSLTNKTAI